jgi:DNA-directed RNA polymerase specialized sigma24 family protein
MRPPKSFPPNSAERLEILLNLAQSVSEFKRIQSVYLRAKSGYNAQEIAVITGLKLQTVRNLHQQFLKMEKLV